MKKLEDIIYLVPKNKQFYEQLEEEIVNIRNCATNEIVECVGKSNLNHLK